MKKILLGLLGLMLIASLVSSACAAGTTTSIRVGVYQSDYRTPVPGAYVYLDGQKKATTDSGGSCYIHYVTKGTHRLGAYKPSAPLIGQLYQYCSSGSTITVPAYRSGYIPFFTKYCTKCLGDCGCSW